jgi:hypothetical protein
MNRQQHFSKKLKLAALFAFVILLVHLSVDGAETKMDGKDSGNVLLPQLPSIKSFVGQNGANLPPAKVEASINTEAPKIEVPKAEMPKEKGPETVSMSPEKQGYQGNWLKKKEWVVQANDVYNGLYDLVAAIEAARKQFVEKYTLIDGQLDDFYKRVGIDEGKIQDLLESVDKYLEKKKKKEVDEVLAKKDREEILNEREAQANLEQIEDENKKTKMELVQLGADLKSIDDLDRSLVDRMKKIDEQVDFVSKNIEKAKIIINEMWDVIDDRKARASFYELSGIASQIKAVQSYLQEDLLKDLEAVNQTLSTQMKKSQDGIKALESNGLILKDRAAKLEELKQKKKQEAAGLKAAEDAKRQAALLANKKSLQRPWYKKFYDYVVGVTANIYSSWSSIYNKLFGAKVAAIKTVPVAEPATNAVTAPSAPMTVAVDSRS